MSTPHAPRQDELARALLDPHLPCPAGLRAWNGAHLATRFAVHRNNVVGSLVEALADTFPVVHALVGDEFFRAMAALFVRQHPPASPVLVYYGDGFADFIADFEPARSVPYLADVARLEMARVHAFHAADVRGMTVSDVSRALGSGDRIGESRLALHPSVGVIASPHAIVSLWSAHQGHVDLAALDPYSVETALVLRRELEVLVLACGVGTGAFVLGIQRGTGLAESAAVAAAAQEDFDLASTFGLLMAHGALTGIALPDGDST